MFKQAALRRMSRGEGEADGTYFNPVLPGFNPDPSVIRVGKDYFLSTSSFEFTPGAPIFHSTDLIQWTLIGHALTRKSQLDIKAPEPGGGVWACTLRHHDGWFYLATCVWDRYRPQASEERAWPRGFYVKTQNIWDSNSWSDPVYFDQCGFDQDLFWDDDGTVYLSTTHGTIDRDSKSELEDLGIHICSVDLATGNSTSDSILLRQSTSGIAEGSHILKKGKYYYLFTAEGGTESGHSECCFRSEKSPLGPWESCPSNPLIHNTTEEAVQNTGHCDFVQDSEGQWWAFCLAVRPEKTDDGWSKSVFGRETFLMPMTWTVDDWPQLNQGRPIGLVGAGRGLYVYHQPPKWRDNFVASELQLGWYRKNTPVKPADVSVTERPGFLRMHAGPYKLSSPAAPTALFRKLQQKQGMWRTRLSFEPALPATEAGTVAYWNYLTFSSIGIRRGVSGGRQIRFTPVNGEHVSVDLETASGDVDLVIACQKLSFKFGYQEVDEGAKRVSADANIVWVGEASSASLTEDPSIGMPFTGLMLGLYAYSEMQRGLVPADFAFAEFL